MASASWESTPTDEGVVRGQSSGENNDWGSPPRPEYDGELGACALALMHAGDTKAAALLWDVLEMQIRVIRDLPLSWAQVEILLLVEPWILPRFDDETKEKIRYTLNTVLYPKSLDVENVYAVPQPAGENWRENLKDALSRDPLNQATLAPLPNQHPRADGLAFRTNEELRVYESLKRIQEARDADDTFSIVPNCAVRFLNRTLEPDFLVILRGRCAAIEVDGASHNRRWQHDKSRDDLLAESGIAFVKRLDVRDIEKHKELHGALSRVLARLERAQ